MDPIAALKNLLEGMLAKDSADVCDGCGALHEWYLADGFIPNPESLRDMLATVLDEDYSRRVRLARLALNT